MGVEFAGEFRLHAFPTFLSILSSEVRIVQESLDRRTQSQDISWSHHQPGSSILIHPRDTRWKVSAYHRLPAGHRFKLYNPERLTSVHRRQDEHGAGVQMGDQFFLRDFAQKLHLPLDAEFEGLPPQTRTQGTVPDEKQTSVQSLRGLEQEFEPLIVDEPSDEQDTSFAIPLPQTRGAGLYFRGDLEPAEVNPIGDDRAALS